MGALTGLLFLFAFACGLLILILTVMLIREARRPPVHSTGYAIARNLPTDPGDLGLAWEAWTLDRPDGARLPVWEIGRADFDATESSQHTAVLLHGWGQSRIDMLPLVPFWLEYVDRVVLYDLRGHCDATGDLTRLGCREEDDLLTLLETLDDERFMIAGFSLGAVIVIQAAAHEHSITDRISAIVAIGPYDDFHASLRGRLRTAGYPARPMSDLAMIWFRLIGLRHRPTTEFASRLKSPLLVVSGGDDIVAPLEHGRRIAEASPNGSLHTIESAQHRALWPRDAGADEEAIRAFIIRAKQKRQTSDLSAVRSSC